MTTPVCPVLSPAEDIMIGRSAIWLLAAAMAQAAVSGSQKELSLALQQDTEVAQDPCRSAPSELSSCAQASTATPTNCSGCLVYSVPVGHQ